MSTYQFEDVVVPHGSFIGWGEYPGQHVTGKVLDYAPRGGTDFNNEVCPQLTIELVEPAASFNKQGERTDYPAGDLVLVTCGLVSLKRAIKAADPSPGDVVKILLETLERVPNGTVKVFKLQIARGAAPEARRQPAPAAQQFVQPTQQAFGEAPAAAAPQPAV
ncbi:MAG: hypothetical protein L0L50_02435, partial [Propionibacterium sp.]|nr:hypothetical protein [Propionibacterium sp.]